MKKTKVVIITGKDHEIGKKVADFCGRMPQGERVISATSAVSKMDGSENVASLFCITTILIETEEEAKKEEGVRKGQGEDPDYPRK
jgi:hypothetical protein